MNNAVQQCVESHETPLCSSYFFFFSRSSAMTLGLSTLFDTTTCSRKGLLSSITYKCPTDRVARSMPCHTDPKARFTLRKRKYEKIYHNSSRNIRKSFTLLRSSWHRENQGGIYYGACNFPTEHSKRV